MKMKMKKTKKKMKKMKKKKITINTVEWRKIIASI